MPSTKEPLLKADAKINENFGGVLERMRAAFRIRPCGKCGCCRLRFVPVRVCRQDYERGRCGKCRAKAQFCVGCAVRLPEMDGMIRGKTCPRCEEKPLGWHDRVLHVGNPAPVVPHSDLRYHGSVKPRLIRM